MSLVSAGEVYLNNCKHTNVPGNQPSVSNPEKRQIDVVVDTICNCFNGPQTDECVELQILKALLTIQTSQHVVVHDSSLLSSVRTCYDIYLAGKNMINQNTAKATLNQMISAIFSRMENKTLVEEMMENAKTEEQIVTDDFINSVMDEVLDNVIEMSKSEGVDFKVSTESLTRSVSNGDFATSNIPEFVNMYMKDAFLIFRSLCKLSMEPLQDGPPDPNSHELRSKILSLQLILSVMQNAGPVFRSNEMFISAVKQYLVDALSKNDVSNAKIYNTVIGAGEKLIQNVMSECGGASDIKNLITFILCNILVN